MDIVFDVFIEDPTYIEIISADEEVFYSQMKGFIEQRLTPLKDEIDKEEKINKDTEDISFIMVFMLRNDNRFIKFHNYTKKLTAKMLASFSPEDFSYIENKIGQFLSERNN